MLGQVHDHRHVVLDDEQRHAHFLIGPLEAVDQAVDQGRVDPRRRLVEQKHPRLVHQRHGELEKLLLTEGEIAGDEAPLLIEPDIFEQGLGPLGHLRRVLGEHVADAFVAVGDRDQHVSDAVHLRIDPRLLEGAQQAQAGDPRDPQFRDLLALEPDRAGIDGVIADDRVEQRRLARAVGADQAGDPPFGHIEGDIVVGDDAAEGLGDAFDLDHLAHSAAPRPLSSAPMPSSTTMPNFSGHFSCAQPRMPCWKKMTMMMISEPSATHCQPSM